MTALFSNKTLWISSALLVIIFGLVGFPNSTLQVKTDLAANLGNIAAGLFAITLIIERAVEVLLGVPRAVEGDQKDNAAARAKASEAQAAAAAKQAAQTAAAVKQAAAQTALQNANMAGVMEVSNSATNEANQKEEEAKQKADDAQKAEKDLNAYDAETRRKTVALSFFLGTIAGLLGVRILGEIFVPRMVAGGTLTSVSGWFHAFDIFVTAALIAGGSKALHLLFSTFSNYLEQIKKPPPGNSQPAVY